MKLSYKYHTFNIPLRLLLLLKRHIVFVRAAGGFVSAPDGRMLLILRNGRWDLPKGKVEPGETLLQAALREVQEETGIHGLSPSPTQPLSHSTTQPLSHPATPPLPLPTPLKTYHLFRAPSAWFSGPNPPAHKWHLKQTSWFPLSADIQPFSPQLDEGISAAEWVDPSSWYARLQSSYGTLRTLSSLYKSSPLSSIN